MEAKPAASHSAASAVPGATVQRLVLAGGQRLGRSMARGLSVDVQMAWR